MAGLKHYIFIMLVLNTAHSLKTNTTQIQRPEKFRTENKLEVLSRKRRFLVPQTSGWTFTVTFDLTIPIEGLGSSLSADVPIKYAFDDGRYIYL